MKYLLIIITVIILFSSCDREYIPIDRGELKVKQIEYLVEADTCLVITDMNRGESFIYNVKEDTYIKSYSNNHSDTGILILMVVFFFVGLFIGFFISDV